MSDSKRDSESFLNANQVRARYGGVSHMWLIRRMTDSGFPPAVRFGRLRFWRIGDLERWERDRAAQPAPARAQPPDSSKAKKRKRAA